MHLPDARSPALSENNNYTPGDSSWYQYDIAYRGNPNRNPYITA